MWRVSQYQGPHRGATIKADNQNAGRLTKCQRQVKSRAKGGISTRAKPVPLVKIASEAKRPNQAESCHLSRSMNREKQSTAVRMSSPTRVSAMTMPPYV